MSEQPQYKAGQVVNGFVWTGSEWLPLEVQAPKATPVSSVRILVAVTAFIIAAVAGLLGLSWMAGAAELQDQGNEFAGLGVLLGLGAFTVAAAFGITGVLVLAKR